MINSLTLLPKSIDVERVDDLLSKLISSVKQANGLLKLKVNEGPLMSPGGGLPPTPRWLKPLGSRLKILWLGFNHLPHKMIKIS